MSFPSFQRPSPGELRGAAPTLLQAVLALALVIQAARLLWVAAAPLPTGTRPPATLTAEPVTTPLLASHGDVFFPQAGNDSDATGYTLLGVRVTGDGGSAILAKGGTQVAHALGDTVAAGITLAAVAADHVLLRAGGRDHRVALAQPSPSTLPAPRPLPVAAPPAANAPTATVDGQPLNPERLDNLKHEPHGTATVPVRRDGQTRTLTLQAPQ